VIELATRILTADTGPRASTSAHQGRGAGAGIADHLHLHIGPRERDTKLSLVGDVASSRRARATTTTEGISVLIRRPHPMIGSTELRRSAIPDVLLFRLGDFYETSSRTRLPRAPADQLTAPRRPMRASTTPRRLHRRLSTRARRSRYGVAEAPGREKKLLRRDVVRHHHAGHPTDTAHPRAANNFLLAMAVGATRRAWRSWTSARATSGGRGCRKKRRSVLPPRSCPSAELVLPPGAPARRPGAPAAPGDPDVAIRSASRRAGAAHLCAHFTVASVPRSASRSPGGARRRGGGPRTWRHAGDALGHLRACRLTAADALMLAEPPSSRSRSLSPAVGKLRARSSASCHRPSRRWAPLLPRGPAALLDPADRARQTASARCRSRPERCACAPAPGHRRF